MADRNTEFKDLSTKEKIEHIWEYYKWVIIGAVAAVVLVASVIIRLINPEPEVLMNAMLVNANSYQVAEENAFSRYLLEKGYDNEETNILVNTTVYLDDEGFTKNNMNSQQILMAKSVAGEIDLLVGNEAVFQIFGSSAGMLEMSQVLPKELLEKYKEQLYVVKDDETGKEHVCGIQLPLNHPLQQDGYYEEEVLVGIPYTASNPEIAKDVLIYLLNE